MGTPVNASPASLRMHVHDSEPKWCATPFLYGSLIRYSMPVYLGASLITLSTGKQRLRNRQAALFRRLKIDHKLKLRRLFHRQIGGFASFRFRPRKSGRSKSLMLTPYDKSPQVFTYFCPRLSPGVDSSGYQSSIAGPRRRLRVGIVGLPFPRTQDMRQ